MFDAWRKRRRQAYEALKKQKIRNFIETRRGPISEDTTIGTRIETGVMVMKDGKAWGTTYADGQRTCYGWLDPAVAPMHDPLFCKKPTDVTYKTDHNFDEIASGELVLVERRTDVRVLKQEKV